MNYQCPVCQLALTQIDKSLKCDNQHSFDIAKRGYVNLLLSNQMNSKQPGDNKEMILARSQFLNAGYYQPLIECIAAQFSELSVKHLLDAGCGEGYYTDYLNQTIQHIDGVDISKEGILQSSKRNKAINWCIGSVTSLPYLNESFDAVLSIFCRVDENEFARVLKQNGYVLFIGPADNHLPNLRANLYENVLPYQTDKQEDYFSTEFELVKEQTLSFEFEVKGEDIIPLLTMTPHYWKCSVQQKEKLAQLTSLKEQADFNIKLFKKG
ncbi:putative RNA methyltransferase [Marinicellulosiphila megalodicopiae]|uniref:putative RNA methyltransferase n=1 Tax=Marinicellulosiphila megalodicopiae TaxID=2724896 RepID=UPI003BAE9534